MKRQLYTLRQSGADGVQQDRGVYRPSDQKGRNVRTNITESPHRGLIRQKIVLDIQVWQNPNLKILMVSLSTRYLVVRGLYIGKYLPPWRRGISADVIWGKNMKRRREKEGKCKRKGRKGKEKGRRGKQMRKGEVKE
jgi:hypothetical protein